MHTIIVGVQGILEFNLSFLFRLYIFFSIFNFTYCSDFTQMESKCEECNEFGNTNSNTNLCKDCYLFTEKSIFCHHCQDSSIFQGFKCITCKNRFCGDCISNQNDQQLQCLECNHMKFAIVQQHLNVMDYLLQEKRFDLSDKHLNVMQLMLK